MGIWVEHASPPGETVVDPSPAYRGTQQLLGNCLPLRRVGRIALPASKGGSSLIEMQANSTLVLSAPVRQLKV
jgi:hypothetical protein